MDANVHHNFFNDDFTKPKQMSYASQFGILLALIIGGLILAAIMQLVITLSMVDLKTLFGGDQNLLMSIMAKPENFTKVVLMQAFGTLFLMAIPALIFSRIVQKNWISFFDMSKYTTLKQVGLVIAIALVGMVLSSSLGTFTKWLPLSKGFKIWAERLESTYESGVMIFVNIKTFGDYIFSMLMIAVLPAIFEELLFRGAIQKLFTNWFKQHHAAIIVTAIFFSLVHASAFGFLSRMMLGIVLGYVYYYGKNIWLNILMHFINNGLAVTAMYIAIKNGKSITDSMNDELPIWYLPISLAVIILLLVMYKKTSSKLITQ